MICSRENVQPAENLHLHPGYRSIQPSIFHSGQSQDSSQNKCGNGSLLCFQPGVLQLGKILKTGQEPKTPSAPTLGLASSQVVQTKH